jgi:hypothetical protein
MDFHSIKNMKCKYPSSFFIDRLLLTFINRRRFIIHL